jgi:hypothetical protein
MIVVLIVAFILTMMYGWKQSNRTLGNDVAQTIRKAHLGRLPLGEYAEQYVSKGVLSATELRYPLSECTIRQMNDCSAIRKNDVMCRMVKSSFSINEGQVLLSLSISFEGVSIEGNPISIEVNKYITAYVVKDKIRGWTLNRISS